MLITRNIQRGQRGLSLIEMMVSMTIGMIVVSGALYLAAGSMAASRDNIRMSFLNQELRNVMSLMTNDLRRASSWGAALGVARVSPVATLTFSQNSSGVITDILIGFDPLDTSDALVDALGAQVAGAKLVYLQAGSSYSAVITGYNASSNSFTAKLSTAFPATVLAANGGATRGSWTLIAPEGEVVADLSGGHCAIFSYDIDANGIVANTERMGFRHSTADKAVEMRKGGTDCAGEGWEQVTDSRTVEITDFTVTDLSPAVISGGGFKVGIREFSIEMTGRLKSDPKVVRSLRETIRVRNDRVS